MRKGIRISEKDGRRVVEGLGYYEPKVVHDLKELVKGSVSKYGDAAAFKYKDKDRNIISKTYNEFGSDIDCLGTALVSLGLKDSYIAILSENRYEWGVCYFSIVNGTGVVVPMDKYLPKNEVENLIERGKVEAIFYSPAFSEMMQELADSNKRIRYYICMEKTVDAGNASPKFKSIPELMDKGKQLLESGDKSFVDAKIDRNKLSVLLFTSGTTSMAKGVMLSHSNIASNVTSITTAIHLSPEDVYLSILPLHHTFENTIGLMLTIHCGICIAYTDGIKYIAQNLKEYGVTVLVGVPAIFEAMYRKLQEGIEKSGKAGIVKVLMTVSQFLRFFGIDLRRKLFKSIFEKLGPGLRIAVSGAAPLDTEVIKGFDRLGLKLLQGYGLTEASPVVAANNDFVNVPGTIGYPIGGVEVAIDSPDENGMGEILARGNNIMLGYYEDAEATSETIDEHGWFKTGDLGTIDDNGFIRVTGRAKSMIVFTNGKKAFPEEYEVLLNNIPGVKDSFAWGNKAADGDIQVCAKLVVDLEKYMEEKGQVPSEKELGAQFEAAIKEINRSLPQYKIIRYFVMTDKPLIKTTTLKIKRPAEYDEIKEVLNSAGVDMRKASGKYIENIRNK